MKTKQPKATHQPHCLIRPRPNPDAPRRAGRPDRQNDFLVLAFYPGMNATETAIPIAYPTAV